MSPRRAFVLVTLSALLLAAAVHSEGAEAEPVTPVATTLRPTTQPAPEAAELPSPPEPEPSVEDRARFFGARAGMFLPAAVADESYTEAFTFGAFYAGEFPLTLGLPKLPFEAGLDAAWSDSRDGRVKAGFYSARFDLLFSDWSSQPPRPDFYLLGGYGLVLASLEVDGGRTDGEYVSAFNLGAGLGSVEQRWDARVAYSILAGSGNVRGLFSLSGGYRF